MDGLLEGESGRVRGWRKRQLHKNIVRTPPIEFWNPFPYMSDLEARVYLWLQDRRIPFSWRYFDGFAPNFTELVPGFTPEFTLSEYKIVILMLGTYYGQLPGVLDKNAMAKATLEYDGWKVAMFWESDITLDTEGTILKELPELRNPAILGWPKANPTGVTPDYISKRREILAGLRMAQRRFFDPKVKPHDRDPGHRRRYRNRSRLARSLDSTR